jgi:hypothetical protein
VELVPLGSIGPWNLDFNFAITFGVSTSSHLETEDQESMNGNPAKIAGVLVNDDEFE